MGINMKLNLGSLWRRPWPELIPVLSPVYTGNKKTTKQSSHTKLCIVMCALGDGDFIQNPAFTDVSSLRYAMLDLIIPTS